MSINDFDELRGLHGTRSEAASNCLVRYFQILRCVKQDLRSRFIHDDLKDMTDAVYRLYPTGSVGSESRAITESIANQVSPECAAKLKALSEVERVAFVDAVERTANTPKKVRLYAAGSRFML